MKSLRFPLGVTVMVIGLIMHLTIGAHKFLNDVGDMSYFIVYWPWWLIGIILLIGGGAISEVYKS